jgi:NNP family nitrate/nitrite transporter-like MFS transporter
VAGIVGAGGNVAAVAAGFLFKSSSLDWSTALLLLGVAATACSFLSLSVSYSARPESAVRPVVRPFLAPAAELATVEA